MSTFAPALRGLNIRLTAFKEHYAALLSELIPRRISYRLRTYRLQGQDGLEVLFYKQKVFLCRISLDEHGQAWLGNQQLAPTVLSAELTRSDKRYYQRRRNLYESLLMGGFFQMLYLILAMGNNPAPNDERSYQAMVITCIAIEIIVVIVTVALYNGLNRLDERTL